MPSPLTSSFASAAAGKDTAGGRRGDGSGSGDWPRNRTNGATQTFRRPSLATNVSQNREGAQAPTPTSSSGVGVYVPPHLNSSYSSNTLRNGSAAESRYNKDQLLNMYKKQKESENWGKNIGELFMGEWNPTDPSAASNGSWARRDENKDPTSGPEICWDHGGNVEPLGLLDMTDEEKDLFITSVNSPLKPPPAKEGTPNATSSGRKTSISQRDLGSFNAASPASATRPGPRRRETGESATFGPLSPTGNSRFFRDEPAASTPPAALLRRKTDLKESGSEVKGNEKEKETLGRDDSPFGPLKRSTTGPMSAGFNGPSSAWPSGPPSAGFGTMGTFGSFSLGQTSAQAEPVDKRPGFGSLRGESRFKGLLSKSSIDEGSKVKEKSSFGSLGKVPEAKNDHVQEPWSQPPRTRGARSETNPFGEDIPRSGSAALGGDLSPPNPEMDQLGMSAFGLSSHHPPMHQTGQNFAHQQTPQGRGPGGYEPMSPTNTNPYQSPDGDRMGSDEHEADSSDFHTGPLPGFAGSRDEPFVPSFGTVRRGVSAAFEDRSQTSSAGPNRGFPGLGGFGGLSNLGGQGGWSGTTLGAGTPSRERGGFASAFGDPLFGAMNDLQSPSQATMGGSSFFGAGGSNTIGRGSKLSSLFPQAMQEQMRGDTIRQDGSGETFDRFGDSGRAPGSANPAGAEAFRGGNFFGDIGPGRQVRPSEDSGLATDSAPSFPQGSAPSSAQIPSSSAPGSGVLGYSATEPASQDPPGLSQTSGNASSNQVPAAQQRQMVMPDRMRWIYRDPQGNTQGPWSGLEMHDWFKAGFFTAELQVKKLEDTKYEPLAQLVRRIGNSREPFLVPQIGVPHGPPAPPNQTSPWTAAAGPTSNAVPQAGAAQPPFANSFPSFGTTLTAEQQNALERRKQEEQYLMARQKEHLAQQQVLMKQMSLQGGPHSIHQHALQHHSSAHSLHSQPSFGSITSPSGYQPSPIQGPIQPPQPVPGFFENSMRQPPTSNAGQSILGSENLGGREDEMSSLLERMNVGRGNKLPFATGPSFGARQQENMPHSQQVSNMLQDRARLQMEQEQHDMSSPPEQYSEQNDRLRQFQQLRAQTEIDSGFASSEAFQGQPIGAPAKRPIEDSLRYQSIREEQSNAPESDDRPQPHGSETLTQQVQKAASAQQPAAPPMESPWGKVDTSIAQPFPPPQSASPLPAPAAQRNRHTVADTWSAESRSRNQTPIDTPSASIAPWARESGDGAKGPSLKEIQEVEARKAALQEEVTAAARRAQAQADLERLSQQPTAPAPGLPSSSTWGSSGSPATPTTPASSVWAKSLAGKAPVVPTVSGTKKTLAQIQKEEENKKQRLAAVAAAQITSTSPAAPAGKRYADLASKIITTSGPAPGTSAWTTVGSSGKVKTPSSATAPPVGPRSASGTIAPLAPTVKARPAPTTARSTGPGISSNQNKATEELTKWTKSVLGKGLNSSINVDDFVQNLLVLPAEPEIISDVVYGASQTLDGRRIADEFVRRRKLADKGVVVDQAAAGVEAMNKGGAGTGGWSEVAKKGPATTAKEDTNSAFKVVAAKKKGKK